MFPSKDLAIVLDVVDKLKLRDYIVPIGKLVGPKQISFASRISRNRICIFLSSKQNVDEIVNNHGKIEIEGRTVTIRRLISPAKRIILSNVCPSIPHELLENALRDAGCVPVSSMTFLRANIEDDEFSHILSFRRQIYIKPDDDLVLPPFVTITLDNTDHRIFIGTGEMLCFLCKELGHKADQCPNLNISQIAPESPPPQNHSTIETVVEVHTRSDDEQQITELNPSAVTIVTESAETARIPTKKPSNKRPASSTINTASTESSPQESPLPNEEQPGDFQFMKPNPKNNKPKPKSKKIKKSPSLENVSLTAKENSEIIKQMILENPSKYILTSDQFESFIEQCTNGSDPLTTGLSFTDNIDALVDMMKDIYPCLTNRYMKGRYTRICNKLSQSDNVELSSLSQSSLDPSDSERSEY